MFVFTKMTSNKLPDIGVRIKTEPGLYDSERLSSFKLPRDLTLGGASHRGKRTFTPNLNIVRNKNKNDASSSSKPNARNMVVRGRGRGERGRGADRGRGRGRGAEFIQSQGVFSEGMGELKRSSGWSSRSSSGGSTREAEVLERPKVDFKQEIKFDKQEEDRKLEDIFAKKKQYADLEPDHSFEPLSLPYRDEKAVSKPHVVHKVQGLNKTIKHGKMPVLDNLTDLFQGDKQKLIFFQFPDSLPAFGNATEPSTPVAKDKKAPGVEENSPTVNRCSLSDLEEGLAGKIVIYKSGRAKIFLGNNEFNIDLEMQRSFQQDVMVMNADPEDKDAASSINLGHIEGGIVVTPDWNYTLQNNIS